ncbi:terpene synthase family protein [Kitasatospora terrestris]|uniref:Terpene synthase n=1 Tax=Kitasatospora terrestris TaxID=258051 RepID=A0ABP9DE73_9ACTN
MSDLTSLEVPFPLRRNPHYQHANDEHQRWLERFPALAAIASESVYARWDVADLAAVAYPSCSAESLTLATDLLGFYLLFDDGFDGELGRRPADVARICERLTGLVFDPDPARARTESERAFLDLWERSTAGMPARWLARAAYNWERYFASHPAEAAGRVAGLIPDREGYLVVRRGTAAMETVFDMIERLDHLEVPQAALHHPVLRQLRQIAADVPSLSNDVYSYPLEAPRGDVYNLVMVARRERGCSIDEAFEVVLAEAQQMIDHFAELTRQLPDAYRQLGLTTDELEPTRRYVDGLTAWLVGYLDWEERTGRYAAPQPAPHTP